MQRTLRNGFNRQHGMGIIGWMVTISIVGILVLTGIQLTPVYIQYFNVKKTMENMKNDSSLQSATNQDIFRSFQKRLDIGQIYGLKPREHYSVKKVKGKNAHALSVHYEERRPLLGNVAIVASFDHTVEIGK